MDKAKIGVYLASILPLVENRDLRKGVEKIAEMGFKGVQFLHYNAEPMQALTEKEKRELMVDLPQGLGLTVSGLAHNISSESEGTVAERMAGLCKAIDMAQACKIPVVILHGGERLTENEEENRQAWRRLIENMNYVLPYGEDKGVQVAMEPGGGVWMVHGWKILRRLRDDLGESFKVNLDPANIRMAEEDPVQGVYALRDSIVHMHIKDARIVKTSDELQHLLKSCDKRTDQIPFAGWVTALKNIGAHHQETPVGEGEVDFKALTTALAEIGFDGWMAIEREGKDTGTRKQDLEKAREHVAACL